MGDGHQNGAPLWWVVLVAVCIGLVFGLMGVWLNGEA